MNWTEDQAEVETETESVVLVAVVGEGVVDPMDKEQETPGKK